MENEKHIPEVREKLQREKEEIQHWKEIVDTQVVNQRIIPIDTT